MLKKLSMTGVVLAVMSCCVFAASPEQTIQKVLEQKVVSLREFNPHLTDAQKQKVANAWNNLFEYMETFRHESAVDVVKSWTGIYQNYTLGPCGKLGEFVENAESPVEHFYRMNPNVTDLEQDLHAHAVDYALYQLIPSQYRSVFHYNNTDYKSVSDWKKFHDLCQYYMEDILSNLEMLAYEPELIGNYGNGECNPELHFIDFIYPANYKEQMIAPTRENVLGIKELSSLAHCVQYVYQNPSLDENRIVEGLDAYLTVSSGMDNGCHNGVYTFQGLNEEHALKVALKQIIAKPYSDNVSYNYEKYPSVKSWEQFDKRVQEWQRDIKDMIEEMLPCAQFREDSQEQEAAVAKGLEQVEEVFINLK